MHCIMSFVINIFCYKNHDVFVEERRANVSRLTAGHFTGPLQQSTGSRGKYSCLLSSFYT